MINVPAVRVEFRYDEASRRWDSFVIGASTALEARQAFTATVITVRQLQPTLLALSKVEETPDGYHIIPAV